MATQAGERQGDAAGQFYRDSGTGMKKDRSGFTLVEIMIVVAVIALLAAITIPSFMRARTTSQKNACINNLRQMESAKEQWALEARQFQGATADTTACTTYLKTTPVCPAGGAYTWGVIGTNATCTINGHTLGTTSPSSTF